MAIKFPTQNKLHYKLEGIDDQTMTSLGHLNLPKDLSIVNRRGYASTNRKGVPYVFRTKVDFYLQNHLGHLFDDDGSALASAYDADMQATLKIAGAQNNWVLRNASVKWTAARNKMLRDAGIKRRQLGAYAKEIRYNYDSHDDTWLAPIDADGNVFAGGTWDITHFTDSQDAEYQLKLVGTHVSESVATNNDALNVAGGYMNSRAVVPADSNLEFNSSPADHSHLNEILVGTEDYDIRAEVLDDVQDQGDNPPYDEWVPADTNNDLTESVELGRAVAGMGAAFGTMIIDIPFGLCDVRGTIMQHGSQTDEPDGFLAVEVLDIYEMQG